MELTRKLSKFDFQWAKTLKENNSYLRKIEQFFLTESNLNSL